MTPLAAFFVGGVVTTALTLLALILLARRLARSSLSILALTAACLRAVTLLTPFRSVIVVRSADPLTVGLVELAQAIERGDVLTQVSVTRSRPAPYAQDGGIDGRA